jgi:hypothetical protein
MIDRLKKPTDVAALAVFRMALGAIVCVSAIRMLAHGWVTELFTRPTFHFKYWGFAWVPALPSGFMHGVFVAIAILGACFATGLLYRAVAPLLFLLFSYVQLVDVTNWLNHYYLVALLLLLSSFMPLGRAWSIDARLFPAKRLDVFPAWCAYLLRFQVAVVYVHAGIAKLSSDWLVHAQPLNIWLASRSDVSALFEERAVAYFFAWGGFFFDTTIAAFLSWRRTRLAAYLVLIAFHVTVGALFPIGMFPYVMIGAALVFFPSDWPRRLVRRAASAPDVTFARPRRGFVALAVAFCALQALWPLRHRLYGGDVAWHEQGMRFSWKVMVREKNASVTYVVTSGARTFYVEPRRYLTDRQEKEFASQPDLVLQLAHRIRDDFARDGHGPVEVRADVVASLNGRLSERMIDPSVDLARVSDGLGKAAWILPAPTSAPLHLRPVWRGRVASRSTF